MKVLKNQSGIEETQVLASLAALAQTQRLRAFRALIFAGGDGLTPSAMAALLDIAPSALSFHLKELVHSGLCSAEQRGRNVIYRASFSRMTALLAYLTEHCCAAASTGTDCALSSKADPCTPKSGQQRIPSSAIQ